VRESGSPVRGERGGEESRQPAAQAQDGERLRPVVKRLSHGRAAALVMVAALVLPPAAPAAVGDTRPPATMTAAAPTVEAPPSPTPAPSSAPAAPSSGAAAPAPGELASPEVVAQLQQALAQAVDRFQRMDVEGVLANVSDRYRTGPLTKPVLREQLRAMFAANDAVRAAVRIDEVRLIDGRAWVYSTGQVTGRVRWLGTPVTLLAWERAPEVAWREGGRWRLIGDQQE
jgi:hypothetical protein